MAPSDTGLYIGLSDILMRQSRWQEAEETIRQAIDLDSDNAQFHFLHGNVLAQQRRFEDAIVALERAVALNPEAQKLQDALVVVRAQLEMTKPRQDDAKVAEAEHPAVADAQHAEPVSAEHADIAVVEHAETSVVEHADTAVAEDYPVPEPQAETYAQHATNGAGTHQSELVTGVGQTGAMTATPPAPPPAPPRFFHRLRKRLSL
jgi:tetratricopeptide (TPR) repeat protein